MSHTTKPGLNKSFLEQRQILLPHCTKEWFKLREEIRSIKAAKKFKKVILNFVRPKENS